MNPGSGLEQSMFLTTDNDEQNLPILYTIQILLVPPESLVGDLLFKLVVPPESLVGDLLFKVVVLPESLVGDLLFKVVVLPESLVGDLLFKVVVPPESLVGNLLFKLVVDLPKSYNKHDPAGCRQHCKKQPNLWRGGEDLLCYLYCVSYPFMN